MTRFETFIYINHTGDCYTYPKTFTYTKHVHVVCFTVMFFAIDSCVRSIFFLWTKHMSFYSFFNSSTMNRGLGYGTYKKTLLYYKCLTKNSENTYAYFYVTICTMRGTSIAILCHTCHSLSVKNVYSQLKCIFLLSARWAIATKQHTYNRLPTLFNISRHLVRLKCFMTWKYPSLNITFKFTYFYNANDHAKLLATAKTWLAFLRWSQLRFLLH